MMTDPTRDLQQKLKAAWAKLPPAEKAKLEPMILAAHNYAVALRKDPRTPHPKRGVPDELMLVHSLLNDDPDGLLATAEPSGQYSVNPEGGILGFGQYEVFDVRWAYTLLAYADTLFSEPSFNTSPQTITIPDTTTIALLGDWGGGNSAAAAVAAAAAALSPGYTVHLGDVYYAGTESSLLLEPYEQDNFLSQWRGGAGTSFALNSNHDMYAHATGYFGQTLAAGSPFSAQQGCSYFALQNSSFVIAGLDTAYSATDFYLDGALTAPQTTFLQNLDLTGPNNTTKTLILLTHHNGLAFDGSSQEALWSQVISALPAAAAGNLFWYWGHVHAGAVYTPVPLTSGPTVQSRCIGHGCMPSGVATALAVDTVAWYESNVVGPASDYFVQNGFAVLSLAGGSLTETIYGQDGKPHWSQSWPAPTARKAA
ncbi:MAG: hypothetical protein R3B70_44550 [Polyangiaceae bacterium]